MDKSFSRLVQIQSCKQSASAIIDSMIKDGSINYQIPVNTIHDPKNKNLEGCTALNILVHNENTQEVQKLLQNGADFTIKNSAGETALHLATKKIYFLKDTKGTLSYPTINAFLDAHIKFNIFQNPSDNNGLSHLHAACIVDHEVAVKFFIENGASVNDSISLDSPFIPGYTPLHLTAKYSGFITFKTLLDHGADISLKNADGLSPFHLLIQRNIKIAYQMEIDNRLVSDNKKLVFKKNEGMCLLVMKKYWERDNALVKDTSLSFFHLMCALSIKCHVEEFLSNGIMDPQYPVPADSPLWPGYTALHFAVQLNVKTAKVLVKHGANILAKDATGTTPFDLCMRTYKVEDVRFVVANKEEWKDVMLTDGKTSLLELLDAMASFNFMFEDFVKRVGANLSIPPDSPLWPGYTALHLAINLAERVEGDVEDMLYLERIDILRYAGADVNAQDSRGSTPIHLAFRLGKYEVVDSLLHVLQEDRSIANLVDERGVSHLHIACAMDNTIVVDRMMEGGANVDLPLGVECKVVRTDERNGTKKSYSLSAGSTPLHIAVVAELRLMTELLLRKDVDRYALDAKGTTPIHRLLAARYGYDALVMGRLLLTPTAEVRDVVTSFGLSHLDVACWLSRAIAVDKLLKRGADVNVVVGDVPEEMQGLAEYQDYRPLNFAMCRKDKGVIEVLFERGKVLDGEPRDVLDAARCIARANSFGGFDKMQGATLKMWEEQYGLTKLHVACYQMDLKAVEELLRRGADPNVRVSSTKVSWFGMTPLHLLMENPKVKEYKFVRIVELFIEHGVDVTVADSEGATVIHKVINNWSFKRRQILLLLLNAQKDFTVNPGMISQRISHFHIACALNVVSIVEKFLIYGVNPNRTVDPVVALYGGYTPLQVAALCNAKETVDVLLKVDADVRAQNWEGNTALHCAAICKNKLTNDQGICEPLIRNLISAGAKVNTANIYGQTPLEIMLNNQKLSNELLKVLAEDQRFLNLFNGARGTGIIAMAIKHEANIKNIIEHPIYKAVINSPRFNEVDENGRTPIHNIVSISKVAASVQVYTKAIEGFVNVGFDVDQQNKKGQTSLHIAVYFRNPKAVAALLSLGANINILCDGKTPFSHHWNDHGSTSSEMAQLLENDRQITKSFAKHVYKLQLIKFVVNEMDKAVEVELRNRQWNLDLKVVEQCEVELERLETRKIGRSDVSWWSLLSETGAVASFPTMRKIQRQMICDVFEKRSFRLRREFPEFATILHLQCRKALNRMSLIEPSKDALDSLLNFDVPDLCKDRILRFLENADLVNLVDADECLSAHVQKRKTIVEDDAL